MNSIIGMVDIILIINIKYMEKKIIIPETDKIIEKIDIKEEMLKEVDKLNEALTDRKGEWFYDSYNGICWKPNPIEWDMGNTPTPPSPPSPLLKELINIGKSIDFNSLTENSVLIIKIKVDGTIRFEMLRQAITKQVLAPRFEILKQKKICVLFLESNDDISVMTEREMNEVGWEKKEKNRIITL